MIGCGLSLQRSSELLVFDSLAQGFIWAECWKLRVVSRLSESRLAPAVKGLSSMLKLSSHLEPQAVRTCQPDA